MKTVDDAKAQSVEIARRILSGAISARSGASSLWDMSDELYPAKLDELDPFIYAVSEWEDRPEDHDLFERMILDQATVIVQAWAGHPD
jgi:hypothetical protein